MLVHELGHVWLAQHEIFNLPDWANEGFCVFLEYKLFKEMNSPLAQYYTTSIEQSNDPI